MEKAKPTGRWEPRIDLPAVTTDSKIDSIVAVVQAAIAAVVEVEAAEGAVEFAHIGR